VAAKLRRRIRSLKLAARTNHVAGDHGMLVSLGNDFERSLFKTVHDPETT